MVVLISWLCFWFIKIIMSLAINGVIGLVINKIALIKKKVTISFLRLSL